MIPSDCGTFIWEDVARECAERENHDEADASGLANKVIEELRKKNG